MQFAVSLGNSHIVIAQLAAGALAVLLAVHVDQCRGLGALVFDLVEVRGVGRELSRRQTALPFSQDLSRGSRHTPFGSTRSVRSESWVMPKKSDGPIAMSTPVTALDSPRPHQGSARHRAVGRQGGQFVDGTILRATSFHPTRPVIDDELVQRGPGAIPIRYAAGIPERLKQLYYIDLIAPRGPHVHIYGVQAKMVARLVARHNKGDR
jgi:hypothetical protein